MFLYNSHGLVSYSSLSVLLSSDNPEFRGVMSQCNFGHCSLVCGYLDNPVGIQIGVRTTRH
jgi:hypothetical protein